MFVCSRIRDVLLLLRVVVVCTFMAILIVAFTGGKWPQDQLCIQLLLRLYRKVEDLKNSFDGLKKSNHSDDNRKLDLILMGVRQVYLRKTMSDREADIAFERFLMYRQYVCTDYQRLGDDGDGGWNVCMHGRFALTKPCLVYSFGINHDFSFDDAVSIKFGCTVRSFDPSMKVENHRRGPNIYFYRIGIDAYNGPDRKRGWDMRTLTRIVDDLNDTGKIIDYLKMDVEWSEWRVLQSVRRIHGLADFFRNRVKQFGLEVHFGFEKQNASSIYRYWSDLFFLEKHLGFRRWSIHFNPYGAYAFTVGSGNHSSTIVRSCCYELVYINQKFVT